MPGYQYCSVHVRILVNLGSTHLPYSYEKTHGIGYPQPGFVHFIKATAEFYEKIEVLEILKENNAQMYSLGIVRILLTDGYSLQEGRFPAHFVVLDTFESKGREHICLVKVSLPPQFLSMPHWTDVEVIWECPLLFTQETLPFSCTGAEPALLKVIRFSKHLGTVTSIAYEAAGYHGYQVLPQLSRRSGSS